MLAEDDIDLPPTPPSVAEAAKTAIEQLVPSKSGAIYEASYKRFMEYCKDENIKKYSENALLGYFIKLKNANKMKSSSMWSHYSMIRSMLSIRHKVDISKYLDLRAFLKKEQRENYQPKKSAVLTKNHFLDFLAKAPDERYLGIKITQLERQIDVLNQLRTSEEHKRDETLSECHRLEKSIETLEYENTQLSEENQNLQNTLEINQDELKLVKSEINLLNEQWAKLQEAISRSKIEKNALEEKIRVQEHKISSQDDIINRLEENLEIAQKKVQQAELNCKIKERKYAQLKCQFKKQIDLNNSQSEQLESLQKENCSISIKVDHLETELNEYIETCEALKELNQEIIYEKEEISIALDEEKEHTWAKSTKQLMVLSMTALQRIAHIMLPAYLDIPQ